MRRRIADILSGSAGSTLLLAVVTAKVVRALRSAGQDVHDPIPKKLIDELALLSYYQLNTGKEVIDNI
jgi:hypothetical protein